jgi:hypothetical protein
MLMGIAAQQRRVLLAALLDEAGSSGGVEEPNRVRSLLLNADNQETVSSQRVEV